MRWRRHARCTVAGGHFGGFVAAVGGVAMLSSSDGVETGTTATHGVYLVCLERWAVSWLEAGEARERRRGESWPGERQENSERFALKPSSRELFFWCLSFSSSTLPLPQPKWLHCSYARSTRIFSS
jgi:hypothetical protein